MSSTREPSRLGDRTRTITWNESSSYITVVVDHDTGWLV